MVPSYDKIYHLGRKEVSSIFSGSFVVQEKIDGSQFSFGIIDGELHCRSKRVAIDLDDPADQFKLCVETVKKAFEEGNIDPTFIYRGESVSKPKHNTLKYSRAPLGGLILFDVMHRDGTFCENSILHDVAARIKCEAVQEFSVEKVLTDFPPSKAIDDLLETESMLGGAKIEGVVIKNYNPLELPPYGGYCLMAKYVSEAFKEVHNATWKKDNPSRNDIIRSIIETYKCGARWTKAVQNLRDSGELLGDPKDIGKILKEIQSDVYEEEAEVIKERLFKHFWKKDISRAITAGFPEWYKKKLVEENFDDNTEKP